MRPGPLTYFSVGIAVSVVFLSIAFFRYWQPNVKEMNLWKEYRDQLRAEARNREAAIKRVQQAEQMVMAQIAQWNAIAAKRTPPPSVREGGIDLSVNGFQLVIDAPRFRNSLQRAINRQMKVGGVKVIQGPAVPAPPNEPQAILASYFNYPAVNYPVVILDLGRVQVEGTFDQISRNMASWSQMPQYLAVADALTLQGTSPRLTGSYALTIVAFIRTPRPIFPPIIPAGVTTPPGGAAPGGPPGVPGAPAAPSGPPPARPPGGPPAAAGPRGVPGARR